MPLAMFILLQRFLICHLKFSCSMSSRTFIKLVDFVANKSIICGEKKWQKNEGESIWQYVYLIVFVIWKSSQPPLRVYCKSIGADTWIPHFEKSLTNIRRGRPIQSDQRETCLWFFRKRVRTTITLLTLASGLREKFPQKYSATSFVKTWVGKK